MVRVVDERNPDLTLCQRETASWISRRTYALLDTSSGVYGASAVPVRIGERRFLATAAHVLAPGLPLKLLTEHHQVSIQESRRNYRKHDCEYDYGYVELVPSEMIPINHWVGLEDLQPRVDCAQPTDVIVSGWPLSLIHI